MPTILLASACPINPCYSGLYPIASGPLTCLSLVTGDTTQLPTKFNSNAACSDLLGRYGGGCQAINSGLALSAGAGLTLNIAAGHANIDGHVEYAGGTYVLTNNTRNWIWLSQAGAITATTTTTAPGTAYCLVGSALTAAGVISSVDTSGVMYLIGGMPWRKTADATTPTDTPPAGLLFFHEGTTKTWFWNGTVYRDISGAFIGCGQYTNAVSANVVLTSAQVAGVCNIELTNGGIGSGFSVTFPATGLTAGQGWDFSNQSGQSCAVSLSGGSKTLYFGNGQRKHIYTDGTEIRESGRAAASYGSVVATSPSYSPSFWDSVEDALIEWIPSGGAVTVNYPTAPADQKGLTGVYKNDSTSLITTVKTAGADVADDTVLLPGEWMGYVVNGSRGIVRLPTRPYTRRAGVSFASDANKTVAHPDFLATYLDVTSGVSLTATRNLVLPVCDHKAWFIKNSTTGGQAIQVIGASGTGVTIANGRAGWVRCDGTNFLPGDHRLVPAGSLNEVIGTQGANGTVGNSSVETSVLNTFFGTATLPASVLQPGRMVRLQAKGFFSTAAAPGTLNVKFKFGTTVIVSTGAQTPTGSLVNRAWEIDLLLTCRTTGGTGTVIAQGMFRYMPTATSSPTAWEMLSTATTTVDTTTTQAMGLTATWNTADVNNTITATNVAFELVY